MHLGRSAAASVARRAVATSALIGRFARPLLSAAFLAGSAAGLAAQAPAAAPAAPAAPAKPAPPSEAETHIAHVTTGWKYAPNGQGLLPAALAEAEVAVAHAEMARQATDLDTLKKHAGHVLNALDPSLEAKGPGAGYGVKTAAAGVRQHAQLAAKMEGASKAVKTHSEHVAASIGNVLEWTEQAVATIQKIRSATSAADAAPLASELAARTKAIRDGLDADGNGQIGWQPGEGGLAQAKAHVALMQKTDAR